MSRPSPHPSRNVEVLHSIVEAYIDSGEPVASRTVSRRGSPLSPASIRNIMADLADEGYLCQPHTSAGRVPTEKAFRSYVASLSARRRLPAGEADRVRAEFQSAATVEDRLERSSNLLTELTRNVGIAAAIPDAKQTLDQVELIALGDHRVLFILVTGDHMVRNRMVVVDENLSQDELNSIRNYINRNFSGWSLADVRSRLTQLLEQESALYDAILKRLNMLCERGLLEIGMAPEVHLGGTSYLIGLDLHLTREKMRELFRALEEKKRVLHLLDRFLEQPAGELTVRVGLAEAHPSMSELSLIGLTVALPSGMPAKIAVLGPLRMNYERVMSAVLHVGQAIEASA